MLFGSKESPTPARPLVEGLIKLRGTARLTKAGGFAADLEGDLLAESTVQILPEARIEGRLSSRDEIVLHAGSNVRGPMEARALDLQEGAHYAGIIRIGPESPGGSP